LLNSYEEAAILKIKMFTILSDDFNVSVHNSLDKFAPYYVDYRLKEDDDFLSYMHSSLEKLLFTLPDEKFKMSMLKYGCIYGAKNSNKVRLDSVVQCVPAPIKYCSDYKLLNIYLKDEKVAIRYGSAYVPRDNEIVFKCKLNLESKNSVYEVDNVYVIAISELKEIAIDEECEL
jgi:hypothetical protein